MSASLTVFVAHDETGYLAETTREYHQATARLAGDPSLRRRMGETGRARVLERYALQVTAPRLVALLDEAASLRATVGPDPAYTRHG